MVGPSSSRPSSSANKKAETSKSRMADKSATYEAVSRNTELAQPIDRFRAQFGTNNGILSEYSSIQPHPNMDPVWIGARIVNTFGLYQPRENFSRDKSAAIKEWE